MKLMHVLAVTTTLLCFTINSKAESNSALGTQVSELKAKVAELETMIAKKPGGESEDADASRKPLTSLTEGIQVSGFVDSSYSYNFNSPDTGTNVGRVFDHDSNSFNVNALELVLQKAVNKENPVGFRTDLYAGNDAEIIHSAGLGTSSESFDLQQAYAEANVPISNIFSGMNDLNLKLGKFVTFAGAEVIEGKDNWNVSRSFGFGYAIPFTHTGVRATYTFDNGWDAALGINNGWDVLDDNNDGKTVEGHFGFNNIALPNDSSLTVSIHGHAGPELAGDNGSMRALGDLVAIYKTPIKPLTLMYNFDYGTQDGGKSDGSSANWYAHAGYIRYDLDDDWSVMGRGEFFNDDDGYRIVSGTSANYRDFTATVEYRPWKNVITRVEYRNDHATEEVFDNDDSKDDSQNTLGGEFIFLY